LLDIKNVELLPDDSFVADRSLNADRFQRETGYSPPAWDSMLKELARQIQERNQ